jgi:hypothetical protein
VQTTAINQLPIYQDSDPLQYGTQMSAVLKAIDPRLPARFASLSAANAAYAAFVAGGGAMTDGMQRSIAGDPQIYANGQWRGMVHRSASQTTFFNTTIADGSEVGVATLPIGDPGWPFILDTSGTVLVAAQADTFVNVQCRLDSMTGPVISQDVNRTGQFPAGQLMPLPLGAFPSGTLTGSHTVIVTARRTLGAGNWNVPAGGSIVNCAIRPSFA